MDTRSVPKRRLRDAEQSMSRGERLSRRAHFRQAAAVVGGGLLAALRGGRARAQEMEEEPPLARGAAWRRQPMEIRFWPPAVDDSPVAQGWRDLGDWFSTLPEVDRGQIGITLEARPILTRTTPEGEIRLSTVEIAIANYAAGTQPELNWMGAYWDGLAFGEQGMCVDLEADYIIRDPIYRAAMTDFYPHLLESSRWEGRLWSLPIVTNADLPYGNLNILRAAGLQPLRAGYTWDQMVDHLTRLRRTLSPGKWAIDGMVDSVQFANLLKQAGGEMYNSDASKVLINSPAGIEALQFISDLIHRHQVQRPFIPRGQPRPQFINGELAYHYETSTRRLVEWAEAIGGLQNIYVASAPTKKFAFTANFGTNITMFKTTPERQDAAWQFLRLATGPEGAAYYSAKILFLPVRRSALESSWWQELMAEVPQYQPFLDSLTDAYRPTHPEYTAHSARLGEMFGRVHQEQRSVKDELDQAARDINAMIDEFNRIRRTTR